MFYQSIAPVYDYIFPVNIKQLEFIESLTKLGENDLILDIGCGTGNLTGQLATCSNRVIGIDLDEELLSIAIAKAKGQIPFKQMNMLEVGDHFTAGSVDTVVSFGNTLPHLPAREDVKNYFTAVHSVLKAGGTFIVQIVNYDRVLQQKLDHLPLLENEHVKFVREYVHNTTGEYVDFKTHLTIKSNNQIVENSIPLLALTSVELVEYLQQAGFGGIRLFGDLNGGPLSEDSAPLLFSCIKLA